MSAAVDDAYALVLFYPCGCVSVMQVVDKDTKPKEVGNCHALAHERRCEVKRLTLDEARATPLRCNKENCSHPRKGKS